MNRYDEFLHLIMMKFIFLSVIYLDSQSIHREPHLLH